MHIGIEVQRLFRQKKHGMEVVALELIKQFQNMTTPHTFTVFAKKDTDMACLRESETIKIKMLSSKTFADWEQFSLPKGARQEKVDFLHCTCNTAPLWSPVPYIVTVHDIIYLENFEFRGTPYQNFGNLYRRFVVPRIIEKSRWVVTVSNFEKQNMLENLNIPEEKIKVVYNAVNENFKDHFSVEEKKQFRMKWFLPENFLLFIGNPAPRKNSENVILAFANYVKRSQDILPMVILGNDRTYVLEVLAKAGLESFIKYFIFPGYISTPEMPILYSLASIFLYPSLREGFGLPILEAMGCGTAVITSNTSSMPEVAGEAAFLVNPIKPDEITEGIIFLTRDHMAREALVAKGLERSSLFTWKTSADKMLEIYSTMA